jgi:Domain of unknown function (DUF4304)
VTARDRYDAMIREEIRPLLAPLGFRKRRNRFVREHDEGWQAVDFQASAWGSRDEVRFTINLAVHVTALGTSRGAEHVHVRIGSLMDPRGDHWWDLDDSTDTAALGAELRELLERLGLPWLEARATLDRLLALARSDPKSFPGHTLGRFAALLEDTGRDALAREVRAISSALSAPSRR